MVLYVTVGIKLIIINENHSQEKCPYLNQYKGRMMIGFRLLPLRPICIKSKPFFANYFKLKFLPWNDVSS